MGRQVAHVGSKPTVTPSVPAASWRFRDESGNIFEKTP